jgi:hypothetical protein
LKKQSKEIVALDEAGLRRPHRATAARLLWHHYLSEKAKA